MPPRPPVGTAPGAPAAATGTTHRASGAEATPAAAALSGSADPGSPPRTGGAATTVPLEQALAPAAPPPGARRSARLQAMAGLAAAVAPAPPRRVPGEEAPSTYPPSAGVQVRLYRQDGADNTGLVFEFFASPFGRLALREPDAGNKNRVALDMECFVLATQTVLDDRRAPVGLLLLTVALVPAEQWAARARRVGTWPNTLNRDSEPGSVLCSTHPACDMAARHLRSPAAAATPAVVVYANRRNDGGVEPLGECQTRIQAWWESVLALGALQPEGFGPGRLLPLASPPAAAPTAHRPAGQRALVRHLRAAASAGLATESGVDAQRTLLLACAWSGPVSAVWLHQLAGDLACLSSTDFDAACRQPAEAAVRLASVEVKYSGLGRQASSNKIRKQQDGTREHVSKALPRAEVLWLNTSLKKFERVEALRRCVHGHLAAVLQALFDTHDAPEHVPRVDTGLLLAMAQAHLGDALFPSLTASSVWLGHGDTMLRNFAVTRHKLFLMAARALAAVLGIDTSEAALDRAWGLYLRASAPLAHDISECVPPGLRHFLDRLQ